MKALVIFLKSRRGMNFAETSLEQYRAALNGRSRWRRDRGKPAAQPRAAPGARRATDRGPRLHRLPQARRQRWRHRAGSQLRRPHSRRALAHGHFQNPRSRVPDSIMPAFRFADADFQAMSAYLASLKTPPPAMTPGGNLQESLRALPRREGRRQRHRSPAISIPRRAISPRPAS